MNELPPVDDAAVERQLRFHQRINRASLVISGVLVADVAALYLGVLPITLRPFVRPVLVFGVTGLFALEAWRNLGYGQVSARFRWTRLTLVGCMAALAIGEALHHVWPSVGLSVGRQVGVAAAAVTIALLFDLRELSNRSRS